MPTRGPAFAIGLALLAVLAGILALDPRTPPPLGLEAPPDRFSAGRARRELAQLLGDETPHPVGSEANRQVKTRLVQRLSEIGLQPEIQAAVGCSAQHATCGSVENVLARIPGARETGILLMAHYDSVPMAPGAGDDGAAVAALLEIARILLGEGPHQNSLFFVFTDGEEAGLLGAEAFFAEHAWAPLALAVFNLEGSGSSGPVQLLRAGPRSGVLLDAFRVVAPYPVASSFTEEVFARMPNDTDFSVSIRASKPGIDFAFAGERSHYHTPLDSLAHLDLATLQHHGENVLPLVRAIADADLSAPTPNYVFASLPSGPWLAWSRATGRALAIAGCVLLALASWHRWPGGARFAAALGLAVSALAAIVGAELGALALADRIAGTRVAWPAHPWPWLLILYALPVLVLSLLAPLVRRLGFWSVLLACWWLWSLAVVAQAWALPLAAHLMLPVGAFAAIVCLLLAFAGDRQAFRSAATVTMALLAGYFLLPLALMAEITQGLRVAPAIFAPLALLALPLMPVLVNARARGCGALAGLALAAGLLSLLWVPLYSASRPQHLSFVYLHDAEADRASFVAVGQNPLPSSVRGALRFAPAAAAIPWQRESRPAADADVVRRASASIAKVSTVGSTRTFLLRPAEGTHALGLVIPKQAPVEAIRVNGHALSLEPRRSEGYRWASFVAPPAQGVHFEIDVNGDGPIEAWLIDESLGLPASGKPLIDARGADAVPARQGDVWTVFSRVDL